MLTDPICILTVLALNVVISEWLVRHTFCRHFGTALLVIVITAIASNTGVIPTSSSQAPVYDGIFNYVAPLSIFFLLLRVNLRDIRQAGMPMLVMFLVGAVGTVGGVLLGLWVIGGAAVFGENHHAVAGMFVGTYVGGSVNFQAIALEYNVVHDGMLYGAMVAVDNIMTAVWMLATIALPRMLAGVWPRGRRDRTNPVAVEPVCGAQVDAETINPMDLGIMLAAAGAAVWVSDQGAVALKSQGLPIPSILRLTTIAGALAQIPAVGRLRGARLLGMFGVYIFLAVIGAICDVSSVGEIGPLGVRLLVFVAIVVLAHGVLTFTVGALFGVDPDIVAVASQANIGGGTSALALARSLGRPDLVIPAVLVGSLGLGLGTYLGVLTASIL